MQTWSREAFTETPDSDRIRKQCLVATFVSAVSLICIALKDVDIESGTTWRRVSPVTSLICLAFEGEGHSKEDDACQGMYSILSTMVFTILTISATRYYHGLNMARSAPSPANELNKALSDAAMMVSSSLFCSRHRAPKPECEAPFREIGRVPPRRNTRI